MLDKIPVGSLSLNNVDINVTLLTLGQEAPKGECVKAIYNDGEWLSVVDMESQPVDPLLRKIVLDYCLKNFPRESIKQDQLVLYFILEEEEND